MQAIPTHFSGELRTLAESIRGSILTANPDVRWDSIIGLEEAAKLLKEAVIQPLKYPELFTGTHSPAPFNKKYLIPLYRDYYTTTFVILNASHYDIAPFWDTAVSIAPE